MAYQKKQYQLVCDTCKKKFTHGFSHTRTCSVKCRRKRLNKIYGRYSNLTLNSGTVGAMSEMMVAVDLMEKGYAVFRALSPACLCDLVAVKDSEMIRVEVRTGYKYLKKDNTKKVSFPKSEKDKDRQDLFGIFVRQEHKVYYFSPDEKEIIP